MLDSLIKVALPEMGESVTEGSIVEWRKSVGQWVDEGETLVDVTTDKVDVEVPSTAAGVIIALHGSEGSTIAVGSVLAEIDPTAVRPAGPDSLDGLDVKPLVAPPVASTRPPGDTANNDSEERSTTERLHGVASHKAQLIAQRHQVDLAAIAGTGPAGLILREDIDRVLAAGEAKAATNGT